MSKCSICKLQEGRGKRNICRHCWRVENTAKNLDKIRRQHTINYLANREKRLKQSKEWVKRQGEDYQSNRMKKRYVEERELNLIRQRTKLIFSHLKVACIKCKRMDVPLEFHHLEPYSYDHFQILCPDCHREAHSKSLTEMETDIEQTDLKHTKNGMQDKEQHAEEKS